MRGAGYERQEGFCELCTESYMLFADPISPQGARKSRDVPAASFTDLTSLVQCLVSHHGRWGCDVPTISLLHGIWKTTRG